MTSDPSDPQAPFIRQLGEYWSAWGRAVQQAAGGSAANGATAAGNVGDGFAGAGGGPWLQAIYQLATQALEQKLDSAGIATAWRQILKARGLWPGAAAQAGMPGAGVVPPLEAWLKPWMDSPAFGPAREHVARWQQFARLQGQADGHARQLQALLDQIMEAAISRFEALLQPFEQEQAPLRDVRALFDLWIEAAEQAWEQAALGEEFARLSAAASAAQMQLQQAAMAEVERACSSLGLPTRREVDQAHLRILQLERQVAQLLAREVPAGNPSVKQAVKPARRPAVARKAVPAGNNSTAVKRAASAKKAATVKKVAAATAAAPRKPASRGRA